MRPLSTPDFSVVSAQDVSHAMRLCEQGKGDELLHDFEKSFSVLTQSPHTIAVSSATSGIHLALLALGVKEGDEVICPTFTFAASAFPVCYQKALPVFVDSEVDTWNISPKHLEKCIVSRLNKGKKPKAIMVVHAYGTCARMDEILTIADHYSIPIIEDAANALGSTFRKKWAGTIGSIGVYSFNRNKIISGGSGGCVVTEDESLANRIRYFAHQAKSNQPYYHHEAIGYNYGISPLVMEIIRLQLPFLGERIEQRRRAFNTYSTQFENALSQLELADTVSNRWLSTFLARDDRQEKAFMQLEGRKVWKPLHTQPVFLNHPYYGDEESTYLFEKGYCLPHPPILL